MSTIVVVGDLVVDNNLYEGRRSHPAMLEARGVRMVRKLGGAAGIYELLSLLVCGQPALGITVRLRGTSVESDPVAAIHHAFATWRPHPRGPEDPTLVWRAHLLGYGEPDGRSLPPSPDGAAGDATAPPDVLVMDDAGRGFRMSPYRASWFLADEAVRPRWIVLKMSDPVARGDLWNELTIKHADRLVCLVSADDLRRGQAAINRGLSWERTIDDLRSALKRDPLLCGLGACRHLVITLSRDGTLWIDNSQEDAPRATLVFDASGAEGGWETDREGQVTGYLTTMAASLAFQVAKATSLDGSARDLDLLPAISAGLAAIRDLSSNGHGALTSENGDALRTDGFPAARMAGVLAETPSIPMASVEIPWTDAPPDDRWMIVETAQAPSSSRIKASLLGPGRLMVKHSPKRILRNYPHASFRKLTVVDRQEIESLRGIRFLMRDYRNNRSITKPLSIGVFGPPGAGKSFGVKQLAEEVFGNGSWLEFNLSQFSGPGDLMGPFHQVRDLVLAGITPVVFWDEFDSRENHWLQFLLAPMQDGRFQDGELNHAIGKCVFVFAGGTSPTYATFSPADGDVDYPEFRLRKGPDFVSRLDAFYDVIGPNQRMIYDRKDGKVVSRLDANDVSYPLRRALLIRNVLAKNDAEQIDIDSDLLNALLLTKTYRHGSRSLEKLVLGLRSNDGGPIRRSVVPPPGILSMFVDVKDFLALLDRNADYRIGASIEDQAARIHAAYRKHAATASETVAPLLDREYEHLETAEKEDNRAAARRTIDVLALVGLGVAPKGTGRAVPDEEIDALLEHHMERLAEAEHDGWMSHRLANGWTRGDAKSFGLRTHPALRPYAKLNETDKQKDRLMVRDYKRRIAESKFCIVALGNPLPL